MSIQLKSVYVHSINYQNISMLQKSYIHFCFRLFDFLNSREVMGKGFSAPLSQENITIWNIFKSDCKAYLQGLKLLNADSGNYVPILNSRNKVPVLGFLLNIESLSGIYDDFVMTGKLR